eukprot:TRINITY_DN393_c0_g1_i13.p2 TRINITY_DN393_c0_g1~~TRINITY_DN393_c0_g1_i13.p2  ORF type:complete len:132 (-),score=39.07 TRINITY_DN393_c0_g1_i13:108-503(-)
MCIRDRYQAIEKDFQSGNIHPTYYLTEIGNIRTNLTRTVEECQSIFRSNPNAIKEELLLASPLFRDFDFGKCVASLGVIIQKAAPIAQELHDDPSLFDIDKIFDETNPLIDQFTDLIEAFDPASKACGIHF